MKERIDQVIKFAKMNPSEFADHIGISRASINHILNGRNNPSLDVVLKILAKFDTINSDWLLYGKEPVYKKSTSYPLQKSLFDEHALALKAEDTATKVIHPKENEIRMSENETKQQIIEHLSPQIQVQKKITKIMVFYSDNTYDSLSSDF
ncbi:MAG: helix-turn-helix domain-containing protein [Dysgonamonadaceae bacterium]|jgi:DNA-binding XRE family transcriptional regulator|nr:helix-turn-helix domain-containing protein [Dysgonamonadaceae bacterium]